MLSTLTIIVLWWSLYFLLFGIAKKLVNTATERQQIEIFSSPYGFIPNKRRPKKWETIYFIIGLLSIPLMTTVFLRGFSILQNKLFVEAEDALISPSLWIIPSLFIGIFISGIFLIIGSKKGLTPDNYWKRQPSLRKITELKNKLKLLLKWLNLLAFVSLMTGMFNFIKITSTSIEAQSFLFTKEKNIPFYKIKRAVLYMKEANQHNVRGRNKKTYKPCFALMLENESIIQLLNNRFYDSRQTILLKEVLLRLHESEIPIEIKKIGIYEASLHRDFFEKKRYKQIVSLFDYARTVQEKRHESIKLGEPFELEEIVYQIDSTSTDYGEGFYTPTKNNRFERVYLTIQNNSLDTFIFVRMNTSVIDENYNEYSTSLWGKERSQERFNSYIPPQKTHSGYVLFDVPNTSQYLKMRYQEGFIDKKIIYFDLE